MGGLLTLIFVCAVNGEEVYDTRGEIKGDVAAVLEDG